MDYNSINEKDKYNDLKTYLELIVKELNDCIEELETSESQIKDVFLIDNYCKAKKQLEGKKSVIIKMKNDLAQIVIPQIDNIIQGYITM